MNTTTPYTPLECLLLFQSLVVYGTEDKSFARIADLLANNDLVKGGETYDAGRLTSDALRELYLQLLSEELRSAEDVSQDGTQPGSKKRKVQGVALPTLKEAQEHKEKLPILIERLYARYRDYMVREIRADEREFAQIRKDILEIERGEWDERILKEDGALINTNGTGSPLAPQPTVNGVTPDVLIPEKKQPEEIPVAPEQAPEKASPTPVPALQPAEKPDGLAIGNAINGQLNSLAPPAPKKEPVPSNAPPTIHPPKQQKPGASGSPQGPAPVQQAPQPPGMAYKWEPPYQAGPPHQPPPYQSQPSSPFPPPQFNGPPYPQQLAAPSRGTFPSPQGLPVPHPHLPSSPMNAQPPQPAHLPPPNAARPTAGPPGVPLDALADLTGQQYRAPSGSPVVQQSVPVPPGGYPQPYPPAQRTPGKGQPQWSQTYLPPYQGTPPQFNPPPQNQRPPFPQQPGLIPTENRQYNSPYNANQGPQPQITIPSQVNAAKSQGGFPSLPNTPTSQGMPRYMTGSGTRWTPTPTGSTPRPNTLAKPPAIEPISPILQSAKLFTGAKPTEKGPKLGTQKLKSVPARMSRRTRAGSTGSHLSTSAMSQADDDADETSVASHVKEEVNTPLPLGAEEETGDTTADESASIPAHRQRPSRPQYPVESPKRLKRKRDESIEAPREPAKPPTHVLWTRNFPKISTSAMESISGHRNASTFAVPVKERDAPGYKHIVLRPQDLKSIKSAILAGHRAATEKEKSMGEGFKSESSTWLPISEDLIPPKGIINSTQLEKELMRMFANAIMFNPDPDRGFGEKLDGNKDKQGGDGYEIDEDGVVKDTKAMFADVEKIIASLRSTENIDGTGIPRGSSVGRASSIRGSSVVATEAEDDAASEATGDGGESAANLASGAKRRRKA
ncbi:hypothetical protein OIDMADRAFT_178560 [Oidiodendron maius Zn]|uniref:Bromo domain-containing protein n=1 Tax=Oidiodendron maius (strain Zn) TaxID=913774 RepID=A0A0C3DKW8_OIDMZ|nr:hypothetical protein OIDMADRAFT_178560 [Oidiodendron maius Zn]